MPSIRFAYRPIVLQRSPKASNNPPWTGDELSVDFSRVLAVTLSTSCKRYGTAIPGPLEAQKRLARRRMMGLATTSAGPGLVMPPAILDGLAGTEERRRWTWQASSPHEPAPVVREGPSSPAPVTAQLTYFQATTEAQLPLPGTSSAQQQPTRFPAIRRPLFETLRTKKALQVIKSQASDESPAEKLAPASPPDEAPLGQLADLILADAANIEPLLPQLSELDNAQLAYFCLRKITHHQIFRNCKDGSRAQEIFTRIVKSYEHFLSAASPNDATPYMALILALNTHQQDYDPILTIILHLLRSLSRFGAYKAMVIPMLRPTEDLRRLCDPKPTPSISINHVRHEIDVLTASQPHLALRIFSVQRRRFPTTHRLSLSPFPLLLTRLLHHPDKPVHPQQILYMLSTQPDIYTPGMRHTTSPTNVPLNPPHVAVVRSVALAIARAPSLKPNQAFRWVLRCFQHLATRGGQSALDHDMSRALSYSGLVRSLQDQGWTSVEKLRYVLKWVERLEGGHVSGALDGGVYDWQSRVNLVRQQKSLQQQQKQEGQEEDPTGLPPEQEL